MGGETWRERPGAGGRGPGAGEGAALRTGLFSSPAGLGCHRESTTCVKFPERGPKSKPESGPRGRPAVGDRGERLPEIGEATLAGKTPPDTLNHDPNRTGRQGRDRNRRRRGNRVR